MSDIATECPRCYGSGFVGGYFCSCPIGRAWRASPRVTIGNETHVFPPGTSMKEAQSVLDEAKRLHAEGLS